MLKKLLVLVIALTIPFLLVVASIRIVANPWFINSNTTAPASRPIPTASRWSSAHRWAWPACTPLCRKAQA